MLTADQRRLLGAFVRAHRERMPAGERAGRRRTPGLRREELSVLAGISTTWCAWIEQGRAVQASPEALARLATALALTPAERAYLFELAGRLDPADIADVPQKPPPSLTAGVAATDHPAYGLDPLWNACCWNAAAEGLFRGWLDGAAERNLLRFVFLEPSARQLIPEWEERATRLLAEFRADYGHSFRDARVRALIDSLTRESAFFDRCWKAQDVQQRSGGLRTFRRADNDVHRFTQHSFMPSERPGYKLVLLVPA